MASATAQRVRFENLRFLAFGSINFVYAGVGAAFANPVRLLNIDNTTDQDVVISFDGINDNTILMARSGKIFDYGSNRMSPAEHLEQSRGERVYVKSLALLPESGGVFVTVIYADNH